MMRDVPLGFNGFLYHASMQRHNQSTTDLTCISDSAILNAEQIGSGMYYKLFIIDNLFMFARLHLSVSHSTDSRLSIPHRNGSQ